jgi:hypothetical protein
MIFQLPHDFTFTAEQVAQILGCSVQTVRRNADRPEGDRFRLPARQNTPGGALIIYAHDLEDFIQRTYIGAQVQRLKAS